jgi:hypothetical protein
MGVVLYILVELALGIGSFAAFHYDHPYWGWGLLIAFVIGLLPVVGDDAFDFLT